MTRCIVKKRLIGVVGLVTWIMASANSYAGQVVGPIGNILAGGNGFYIQFDYSNSSVVVLEALASCAAYRRFYVDATGTAGKVALAIALSAKAANEPVLVFGSGDCSLAPNPDDAEGVAGIANCISGSAAGSF
jgi:hypothetical protein